MTGVLIRINEHSARRPIMTEAEIGAGGVGIYKPKLGMPATLEAGKKVRRTLQEL